MAFEENEISLSELIGALKRRWMLILIPAIIAAGLSGAAHHILYVRMPEMYAAHALIRVGGAPEKPLEKTAQLTAIMRSPAARGDIARIVAADGFSVNPDSVAGSLSYVNDGGLVRITAHAARPELAAALARAAEQVVETRHRVAYEAALRERDELVRYVKETAKPLAVMFADISELRLSPTVVVSSATADNTPVRRMKKSVVIPVFVFTAFLMALIALYLDSSRKNNPVTAQR